MDAKKTDNENPKSSPDERKSTAVDTGRRIDVGHVRRPASFVRRKPKPAPAERAHHEKPEPKEDE
ncbi:MAG TPA: hypothetical protein VEL47_06000, partial [Myxococcota bacterium]|nr:hypothetical protein [Myxococcota bacterium]